MVDGALSQEMDSRCRNGKTGSQICVILAHMQTVDIVVPVYNEEAAIEAFHQQLCAALRELAYTFRFIYVNDGSADGTAARLAALASADDRLLLIELSRNFGHQAALTAGLDAADADFTITLDGDGEHPPELIPQMLELAQSGY